MGDERNKKMGGIVEMGGLLSSIVYVLLVETNAIYVLLVETNTSIN